MKRTLALILSLVLCLSMTGIATAESSKYEVVEMDFMRMNPTWDPNEFGSDPTTAKMIEETGIMFNCSAPSGDWQSVANVMLASGNYPDVIYMQHGTIFNKYVDAGALLPIDVLAEQYGFTNIIDGTDLPDEARAIRTSPDGHLYMVPNWFSDDGFGAGGQAISIRNDLYKADGEPTFPMVSDFYAYLEKLRDANLTMKGSKLWPLGIAFTDNNIIGDITNMWGTNICRYMYYDEEADSVKLMLRTPALQEALRFLNNAYHDGILDPECLTYDGTQMTEAYTQGKYACIINWFWDLQTAISVLTPENPDWYWKSIDIPAGYEGVKPWFGYSHRAGSEGIVITKNCKDPETVLRWISYCISPEGEVLQFYGIEGQTLEYKDGVPYLMDGVYDALMADWKNYSRKTGVRSFDYLMNQSYNWERRQENGIRSANRAKSMEYQFNATKLMNINVDSASLNGILYAEIDAELASQMTKMIIVDDIEQIPTMINQLLKKYEANGLTELEAEWTAQYKDMAAREGLYAN